MTKTLAQVFMEDDPTYVSPLANPLTPAAIRDLRRRLGLTQAALAARIGCSTIAVSYWETGHRTPTGLYAKAVRDLMATTEKEQGR